MFCEKCEKLTFLIYDLSWIELNRYSSKVTWNQSNRTTFQALTARLFIFCFKDGYLTLSLWKWPWSNMYGILYCMIFAIKYTLVCCNQFAFFLRLYFGICFAEIESKLHLYLKELQQINWSWSWLYYSTGSSSEMAVAIANAMAFKLFVL